MDDLKNTRKSRKLKEEALDGTLENCCGPVVKTGYVVVVVVLVIVMVMMMMMMMMMMTTTTMVMMMMMMVMMMMTTTICNFTLVFTLLSGRDKMFARGRFQDPV